MKFTLTVMAVAGIAVSASADSGETLWDQQPNPALNALVDQIFADFPNSSTFFVNDVSFSDPVEINSVTAYFTNINGGWPIGGSGTAVLNIFSKTGALPATGDDPTAGMAVSVDYNAAATGIAVVADGLSENLPAGDYWVGLTPELDFATFGQEFHQSAFSTELDLSAFRNPGGDFGFGTDWNPSTLLDAGFQDAALTLQGRIIPAPATAALLGLGGLVAVRRRR